MATVRLEVDLDSEVYPELYAVLSGLRSARARAERVRQLASAGLVWENVRIYGAAAIGPTPTVDAALPGVAALAVPPAHPPAAPPPPATPERRAPARARARAEPPPGELRSSDFIDLAIDAGPEPEVAPPPRPRRASRARAGDNPQGARELPVLMDVVDESAPGPDRAEPRSVLPRPVVPPAAGRPVDAARELRTLRAAFSGEAEIAAEASRDHDPAGADSDGNDSDVEEGRDDASIRAPRELVTEGAGLPDDAVHLTSLAQKPAARSRLLRMKERGLFKNG